MKNTGKGINLFYNRFQNENYVLVYFHVISRHLDFHVISRNLEHYYQLFY